jgi:hypothetical protein
MMGNGPPHHKKEGAEPGWITAEETFDGLKLGPWDEIRQGTGGDRSTFPSSIARFAVAFSFEALSKNIRVRIVS